MNSSITQPQYTTTGTNSFELTLLQALREGIEYIYTQPYLLNYIFQDLLHKPLAEKYGNKELLKLKQFFSTYKLPVIYGSFLNNKTPPPLISVRIISDQEVVELKGLGEENFPTYDEEHETIPSALVNPQPYNLLGPFSPNYSITTGVVTLPTGFDTTEVFVGEALQSANGNLYPVLSLIDSSNFSITTGVIDNFTNASIVLQNPDPNLIYNFFFFDQVFEIACVVGADSAQIFWLTSLVKFILLRFRKELLEKYNLALSTISMGASELLEVQDTNVQLIVQKFSLKVRTECRVLVDISGPVRGIQGTLNIQSVGDPNFTLTEDIE